MANQPITCAVKFTCWGSKQQQNGEPGRLKGLCTQWTRPLLLQVRMFRNLLLNYSDSHHIRVILRFLGEKRKKYPVKISGEGQLCKGKWVVDVRGSEVRLDGKHQKATGNQATTGYKRVLKKSTLNAHCLRAVDILYKLAGRSGEYQAQATCTKWSGMRVLFASSWRHPRVVRQQCQPLHNRDSLDEHVVRHFQINIWSSVGFQALLLFTILLQLVKWPW